ncbi:MAG: hypothetical protein A3G59_00445 [Candidatus Taylorbacteria bacterium RIFCSPLOWO2_12_FULL_47_20]|uniref:Uncharacterized protein n=2 Tax=Candidatus Tayloriibacteriota TaxID=1817919 RepID=A0A1G2PBT7_9BACT|nr:MAG: hypothetical protein A3H68_03420 [Candidatus Taylorbacteria bacterium RIFCSPLOWO2_02_FULL_46_40]OHA45041.1 MAG: hypothetical protein A3G59_00445 [Candidatus Taylorbacteria bacterium RIFCSPLOWO2_12_FULL_47_20]
MSSPELERQPLPENGVGETEIYGKAQWEVGLQKIIDDAPDKMREEFEQNGQKQPWTEVFRGRLALFGARLEILSLQRKMTRDLFLEVSGKLNDLLRQVESIHGEYELNGQQPPEEKKREVLKKFGELIR